MTDLFDVAAQYGSIAKWFTEDDIKIVKPDEPRLDIMDESNTIVITLKPSMIQYNRDAFVNDRYAQAAKRVAECIRTQLNNTLNVQFLPYKDIEAKFFIVNDQGVHHNYEVDTWHYWMLSSLNELFQK